MMLMPAGVPGVILVALTDAIEILEEEKMAIGKLLAARYSTGAARL